MKGTVSKPSLLDAPDAWLMRLVKQHLDGASKTCLAQTCKLFFQMATEQSGSTALQLDMSANSMQPALAKLRLARKHAPQVKLVLFTTHACKKEHMQTVITAFLLEASKQDATRAVTSLSLKDACWSAILPPVVGQTCPNLTSLSLHDSDIYCSDASSVSRQFRSLRSLSVNDVTFSCPPVGAVGHNASRKAMQMQLQGLTALQSLSVSPHDMECDDQYDQCCSIVNSVAGQLTRLSFHMYREELDLATDLNWAQLGTALVYLDLSDTTVFDNIMLKLLQLPHLTHLRVSYFALEKSYVGVACGWEELTFTYNIDFSTLARLPLHSGLLIKVIAYGDKYAELRVDDLDAEVVQEALANVRKCKGIEWDQGEVALQSDDPIYPQSVLQALPLLTAANKIHIDGRVFGGAAMQALHRSIDVKTIDCGLILDMLMGNQAV